MNTRFAKHRRTATFLLAVLVGLSFGASSAFASGAVHKKKTLSMPNVTVLAGVNTIQVPFWAAIQQGYFKKFGANVTWYNGGALSSAVEITTYLSGAAQFINVAPQGLISAVIGGAPIRAVAALGVGNGNQLAISTAAAAQFHVPQTANSVAQIKAQFVALKGSHIVIATSTTSSSAYEGLYGDAVIYGLTVALGTGGTGADMYLDTVGTTSNEQAAFQSGKVQGLAGTPPVTVLPGAVTINIGKLPPGSAQASNYMATSTTMIQQHSDTVQAVVNGFTEGLSWVALHPAGAQKLLAKYDAAYNGITSPEEIEYLYADEAYEWQYSSYPAKKSYAIVLQYNNLSQPPPATTLAYSTWVVPRFAAKALATIPGLYKWK